MEFLIESIDWGSVELELREKNWRYQMTRLKTTVFQTAQVALLAVALAMGGGAMAETGKTRQEPRRITLVGASIGQDWHFERLGDRVPLAEYKFSYVGVNAFDKTPLITGLVGGADRPDIVLIKECSTYFPGDIERYRRGVMTWVDQLRKSGIQPMLVTTAPVSEPFGSAARRFVKKMLGKPDWLDTVTAYNDWLKVYAQHEKIPVFDLEAVLRRSDSERWLKAEYDVGDRVHLNAAAYKAMDRAFAAFLSGTQSRVELR